MHRSNMTQTRETGRGLTNPVMTNVTKFGHEGTAIAIYTTIYAYIELLLAVVTGAAASYIYTYAVLGWNQTPSNLIGPSLIYGSVLAGVGVSKRRYAKCATKPRWFAASTAFADNIRAVAVVIAALFILKVSSDVSRAGVICEAAAATPITMIARCLWARWAGSRIATGRLYFNRAVILGEDLRLTQVSAAIDLIGRLRAQGVRVHSAKGWPTRPSELVRHNVVDYVLSLSRIGTVDTVVVWRIDRS